MRKMLYADSVTVKYLFEPSISELIGKSFSFDFDTNKISTNLIFYSKTYDT